MSLLLLFHDSGGAPPPSLAGFVELGRSNLARKPIPWPIRPTLALPKWSFAWERKPHLVLPFWEGAGQVMRDFGGTNRHAFGASSTACPVWGVGQYGRHLSFDETDDRMIVDPFTLEGDQATVTPEFTLLVVFRILDNLGSQFQYLMSWGILANTSTLNCYIREASNASDPGEITVQIRCEGAGSASSFVTGDSGRVDDGLWHTFAVTLDTNRKFDVYLDGSRRSGSAALSGTGGFDPSAFEFRIGSNTLSGEGVSSDRFFGGDLALVALHRGAWRADQIRMWAKEPMAYLHSAVGIVAGFSGEADEGFLIRPEQLGFERLVRMN